MELTLSQRAQIVGVSLLSAAVATLLTLWTVGEGGGATGMTRVHPATGPVSYAEAVDTAAPAVVNIYTTKVIYQREPGLFNEPLLRYLFGDRFGSRLRKKHQTSLGSGVILDGRGLVLTNNHVIAGADEIRVVLMGGRTFKARVAGVDPDTDLAVLVVDGGDLPAVKLGDSESLQVGDVVLAIGNPFGVGQTVTMGIVSATGRNRLGINTFENFIQTDAAINPGNSGGALINAHGELVGINTAIFSKSGGSLGIGFAIPATLAQGVMVQLLEEGRVVRGWLGLAGQDLTPELARALDLPDIQGVLVSGVLEGGPADRAGIAPGDVIQGIGAATPGSAQEVVELIAALPPGEDVEITGYRGAQRFTTRARVVERPPLREGSQ